MVFGRPLGCELIIPNETKSKKEFVQRLNAALLNAQKAILSQIDLKKSIKKVEEVKHKSNLKAGDLIGIKVRKVPDIYDSNKLYIRFKGPFTISRVTQEGRVIRVIDPITGEEDPTPISNSEVKRFNSRKGTIFDVGSSQEESFELSSGIDEVSSIDDFHLDEDDSGSEPQDETTHADNIARELRIPGATRVLRSASRPENNATLAKTAEIIVNEPSRGYRNIMVPKASDNATSNRMTVDRDVSDEESDEDIMGNPILYDRSELALFIHTYL